MVPRRDDTVGAAGAPEVVLVHGTRDSSASFDAVVERLADLRVTTYDRPGWGPDPAPAPLSVRAHADDLLARLSGAPVVAVGHSWGGHVVLSAAIRAPASFAAVGVWETVTGWADWWPDVSFQRARSVAERARARPDETAAQGRARVLFAAELEAIARAPYDLGALRVPCVAGYGTSSLPDIVTGMLGFVACTGAVAYPVDGADHMAHRDAPGAFAAFVRRAVDAGAPAPGAAGHTPMPGARQQTLASPE